MRKESEIRSDIQKLNQELAVVRNHESMTKAAVNILKNLGWTHSVTDGWKKPEPKRDFKEFDGETMSHFKAGDFVKYEHNGTHVYYRVHTVRGAFISGTRILSAHTKGCLCSRFPVSLSGLSLLPVSHAEIFKAFN